MRPSAYKPSRPDGFSPGTKGNFLLFLFIVLLVAQTATTTTSGNQTGAEIEGAEKTFFRDARQQRPCVYEYTFSNVGESILLNSENYPDSYPPYLNCSYTVASPRGTQMTMDCSDFNVEASQNCQYDIFYWSVSGNPSFSDRQYACGKGTLSTKTSTSNIFRAGFKSDDSNPQSSDKFRFQCKIQVIPKPCSCGVSGAKSRIVGGTEARIGEIPWRVALFTYQIGHFCSATLISNSWVLTAAHCTREIQPGDTIYADIGDHDVSSVGDTDNQVIAVDRVIQNSLYNDKNQDHDTALLHLSRPVTFTTTIQPLCLPWKYTSTNFQGAIGTASGWGTTYFGGPQSNVLLKVDLNVQTTEACRQIYAGRNVEITDNQMCASSQVGKDTCQADSGGSLDYFDSNTGRSSAIGIVSYGFGCAQKNTPGIYARLVMFLGWIEQNSGETFCKA